MLTGVHHVAYVVRDMDEAVAFWEKAFGLKLVRREKLEAGGFEIAIFRAGEVNIELMRPFQEGTDLARFLEETGGGLHHVAWAVKELDQEKADALRAKGIELVQSGPRIAPTGWKVLNLAPESVFGWRVQLADADIQ